MINQSKKEMSIRANEAINNALSRRIPYFNEVHVDNNPRYICQSDIFGYVDTIIQIASDRLYNGQNKSRNDNSYDICVECRSFRGQPQNLSTGEIAPIAGAYWCEAWQRWLSPRFGQSDVINYYLPRIGYVGSFNRYYLEIMLSDPTVWTYTTGIHKIGSSDTDTFVVFFDYRIFTQLYMSTVARVCGLAELQREQSAAAAKEAESSKQKESSESVEQEEAHEK